jgi:hypothetical protein
MNLEDSQEVKDRKEALREKRELKMLERFQYEPREKRFRESTIRIKNFNNFYSDSLKIPKISEAEDCSNQKAKKRGRKPKARDSCNTSLASIRNKARKKQAVEENIEKSISRPVKVVQMHYDEEDVDYLSQTGNLEQKNYEDEDCPESYRSCELNEESEDYSLVQNPSEGNFSKTQSKNIISLTLSSDGNINSDHTSQKNGFSHSNIEFNLNDISGKKDKKILPPDCVDESEQIRERVQKDYAMEIEKFKMHKIQKNMDNQNSLDGFSNGNNDYGLNLKSDTFINCDLRFFNFDMVTSRIGYFDVVMIDPPWRIKGGQRNDSSFMFSNSKFNLEYNTLSNNEIVSLPVEKLSKKGIKPFYRE